MNDQQKRAKEKALQEKLKREMFAVLDGIYNVCNETAKGYKSKTIPIALLKNVIDTTKKNIVKGMKKK